MKIITLFLCVVLMHSSLLLAMEMTSVVSSDEETPQVVQCLLCKKRCAALVGLHGVYNGNLAVFTLCKNCLTREIKKKPHLFKLFMCSRRETLQESCLVHVVDTPASVLLNGELPLIDINQLSGGFKPWLIQQGREYATKCRERSERLRDCSHGYSCRYYMAWVSVTLLVTACILLIVYCLPCKNACCGDNCGDDKKNDCFYSCDSCTWGVGTLYGAIGLNIINMLLSIYLNSNSREAREYLKKARTLESECAAVWPDDELLEASSDSNPVNNNI